jgi:hypothetical protein
MKLKLLAPITMTLVTLATAMITGCGPGMSSHAAAPNDRMLQAADAELANAIVGTTTLTSATLPAMPLPESRMPVAREASRSAHDTTPPAMQTWGVAAEPVDPEQSEYGF